MSPTEFLKTRCRTSKIAVTMIGARRHYAVPRLLHEAGLLHTFYTDGYVGNKPWLRRLLCGIPTAVRPRGIRRWLGREASIPPEKVISFDSLGFWYVWQRRRAKDRVELDRVSVEMARRFSTSVLAKGLGDANMVWGFNTASMELFSTAQAQGRTCILEQTILPRAVEDDLMRQEEELWRGWQPGYSVPDGESIIASRQRREWELSDKIVVGSDFVREGLISCDVTPEKIYVVPYGVDDTRFAIDPVYRTQRSSGPLRVLFVGEVGLRKGALYLLEALARIGPAAIHARFAGPIALDRTKLKRYTHVADFLGPIPGSEMPQLYQWAHVFALPSIVEGSATASYEALMSGLPIIATRNAGTLVQEGYNGRLIPIRDVEAISSALIAYNDDLELLHSHSRGAHQTNERVGFDRYRRDLERLVRESTF